ncbi:putative ATP-dependent helicase C23E6.02 [Pseudocercospora fuligena]|uniref:Putative ATP-dependent helicase C23E6.02 n=1 Tax=Pseudocercospora fuligena TaxID=685502 RepID=A0A8H6RKW4_9PEZI|nr:putative ATP-dependent helicase C23E6.02 [Pseudocercospora fuligena]
MSSTTNNPRELEAIEDNLAFNAVLIESLDPYSDDYQDRLADLEAETRRLEAELEHHPYNQRHRRQPNHQQRTDGAPDNAVRDDWWQNAMDGRPGSNQSSAGSMSSNAFRPNQPDYQSHANGGVKRSRPVSSFLPDPFEPASKRPTPDPSNAGTPTSSTGSDYADQLARMRQGAAVRRQQEILQQHEMAHQDHAYAQQMNQSRPSQSVASSSRPGVQTTLNYNGGYHKPPPPLPMIKTEPPAQFTQASGSRGSYPILPSQQIKAEPSSSRTHQPSQNLAFRNPPPMIDLTGDDSEDDFEEINPTRFTPNGRQPSRPAQPVPQSAPIPHHQQMPGAYPGTDLQYAYNNALNLAHRAQQAQDPFAQLRNQIGHGMQNGLQALGSSARELSNLMFGSSSRPYDLDDDDDDDIEYVGHRQLPGYANYAGQEDLWHQRYNDFAAYDPSKSKEELEALLANIRPDEDMPAHLRVQTPEDMSVRLHKYQELGLTWLKNQEESSNKGGILADDMGLGKTIQMLSLMVTRKSDDPRCKTTLIIAPVALMRQWKSEIRNKLKPNRQLTVYTHHATHKAKSFDVLRTFDVVLTTYGTIAAELKRLEKFKLRQLANPGVQIQPTATEKTIFLGENARWYRVILDEAQCIKNRTTQTSKGACLLNAKYRFCVTGTPMMNNVEEFFSLIQFLRIRPYSTWQNFRNDFNTPLRSSSDQVRQGAMRKLQILCKSIMLRRTKKSYFEGKPILILPERTTDEVNPVFSEDETAFYHALETQSQVTFNKYLRAGTVGQSYSAILVLLLRLRQACCHPHLIKDFGVAAAADMSEDQMLDFARQLEPQVIERIKATGGNFECPVCYDVTANPAIFIPCGHDTCSECFAKIADPAMAIQNGDERGQARCPNCRGNIDPKRLTDFNSFKKIHMPELLTQEEQAQMEEAMVDSDSDSDEDSDSESDEDENEYEDETLDGFIVDDEDDVEAAESDSDDLDRKPKKAKKRVVVDDEETDSDDLDIKPGKIKTEAKVKNEVDEESSEVVAGPSNAIGAEADEEKPIIKKSKGKGKAKEKSKSKGKGKQKEKKKKVKAAKTLAELKKEASRNKTAKKKYLKRLRKDYVGSAKIEKTMEILDDIMKDKEGEKVLIFSQWTSLLDLLEIPIDEQDYGYRRYDGSMSASMRGDAVDDFCDDRKNVRIMLVSLKAGNAGLNLNMASQVIILDPFWNPYIEEQAIDRAHRIGQKRPVKVHRVLIKGTVEDRIIDLQEKKRALISEALDEQQSQQLGRLGVRELAYLFGVTNDPNQQVDYQPRQRQR